MSEFRVLTYNVHGLRDDRRALAHVVRSCDPDIVCVQEAPRFFRWRSKCARMARDWGLVYVNGGGTTGGVALFAHLRVNVVAQREGLLSKTPRLHQRAVAAAVVSQSDARLVVVATHLGLRADERARHARELLSGLAQLPADDIVAGADWNAVPGSQSWRTLHAGGLLDPAPGAGPTFPATSPVKRIDAVLVSRGVRVVDYRVVDEPGVERASDHRPVLALIDL